MATSQQRGGKKRIRRGSAQHSSVNNLSAAHPKGCLEYEMPTWKRCLQDRASPSFLSDKRGCLGPGLVTIAWPFLLARSYSTATPNPVRPTIRSRADWL